MSPINYFTKFCSSLSSDVLTRNRFSPMPRADICYILHLHNTTLLHYQRETLTGFACIDTRSCRTRLRVHFIVGSELCIIYWLFHFTTFSTHSGSCLDSKCTCNGATYLHFAPVFVYATSAYCKVRSDARWWWGD